MIGKEIVQALRCCKSGEPCSRCPVVDNENYVNVMHERAADLIERLTAENVVLPDGEASAVETLLKEIEWKDMAIALAQRKQEEAEAERDALREKQRWISATEPPKEWKDEKTGYMINYLINCVYSGVDVGSYHAEAGCWLCCGLPVTVTHWMPMPEAPEEGDKA